MATKSYSKHKEYKEYSNSSGKIPYTDEQFEKIKNEVLPKDSKLRTATIGNTGGTREYHYEYNEENHPTTKTDLVIPKDYNTKGRKEYHYEYKEEKIPGAVEIISNKSTLPIKNGVGSREYHYEYKEDKHPTGKYDRKDLRTVEEFTIPPKTTPKAESSSYYYEREEREVPAITSSGTRTYNYEASTNAPGYTKVKTSKVTKDLAHNVDELDSLLDDLQKDQERQLYKSGYTSDTAESTSFDYKKGTPVKAPSSGYSTLKREEHMESSSWGSSPPPTITRQAKMQQEMYREEKTEHRVIPSQVSPALPQPVPPVSQLVCHQCHHTNTGTLTRSSAPMNKVTTTVKTYTYEVPAGQDPTSVPLPPVADHEKTYVSSTENVRTTTNNLTAPSPTVTRCQFCSHCNTRLTNDYRTVTNVMSTDERHINEHTNERMIYPAPANQTKIVPVEPVNGHIPYGPASYKFSETTYESHNTTERYPGSPPRPDHVRLTPSPAPFPRPTTPSPGNQQPPKKLDDLLADFPEARFPTQPDGVVRRKIEMTHESHESHESTDGAVAKPTPPTSKNVAGPAVYYPPGHTPFAKKEGYQAAAMQGGGAYASGKGMYEYESGAKSKEKHTEKKSAVPVCLPLCCAMPCVIM